MSLPLSRVRSRTRGSLPGLPRSERSDLAEGVGGDGSRHKQMALSAASPLRLYLHALRHEDLADLPSLRFARTEAEDDQGHDASEEGMSIGSFSR